MSFTIHTLEKKWPVIRQVAGRLYRIQRLFVALWNGVLIEIRPGFEFDGSSHPTVSYMLIGGAMCGRYTAATTVHDALYAVQLTTRKEADVCMYDIMRDYSVGWVKAQAMYWAVRAAGWKAWRSNQKSGRVQDTRESRLVEVIDMRSREQAVRNERLKGQADG